MDIKRLEHYFYLSFVVSLLIWAFQFWANLDFFQKGLFTSLFLVGSFQIWYSIKIYERLLKFIPLFFLFQAICLLGSGFEFKDNFPIFLSIVPLLAGLYFIEGNSRKILLLSLFVISIFGLRLAFGHIPFGPKESLAFFLTLSWSSGVLLLKADKDREKLNEKYFLHDLLNHTHGLSLFLENRQKKGLSISETVNVSRELESLQNLLQVHFGKGPKQSRNIIKLSEVLNQVKSLCEQFLNDTKFQINTNGDFDADQISYNEFFRAMGNILKNVSDSKSNFCEILIENQENGISIIVKNEFSKKFKKQGSGIGLKSTQEILEKVGGIFCFYVQDDVWVSRIYIPFLKNREIAA